ncbi:activating transcription factor 3-like isoform X1 [Mya arenaria]|uniref:activating transcription factor 3-like isoform X1 n=2 Tax=Mya arenaria TaxID=6604 RepID=UPI0022E72DD4|nr:activating transcription factor 3-like isoform X1 [Mya arenaria]XP_052819786.1 activating transcription factor 3-like isoform X1 [Mya arenaria]
MSTMQYKRQNSKINVYVTMEDNKHAQVVPSVVPTVVSCLFDNNDGFIDYSTSDNVGHCSTINASDIRSDASSVKSVGKYSHLDSIGAYGYTNTSFSSDIIVSDSDSDDVNDVSRRQLLENGLTPFIKEELKYSIQTKRLKEGKQELKVEFSPPPEDVLTPEEEERVEKRRVQNRMAARRFRDKQKDRAHTLQKECHRLQSIQTELRYELAQVRKERDELRQTLDQHMAVCPLQFPAHFHASTSNS